ncbi:MAG: IS3 family transposase [Pleomorphochaeta sp.]
MDKYIHFYNNRLQKKLKNSAPLEYRNRVFTS